MGAWGTPHVLPAWASARLCILHPPGQAGYVKDATMDDLEAAVAALLRQGPASWTSSPSESPDALRRLTQAGFIERRLTFTLRMPGQDAQHRITIEATGEFGIVEALTAVIQDLYARCKDQWLSLRLEVGTVMPIITVERDEWRITEHGRLAQADLANGERLPLNFVLQRGFFDGEPRPLPNGEVTQRLPVRGTGRLVRIENAADRPLEVNVTGFSAAPKLAEAFAAAFAAVQLPATAKSAAQEAAPQPPQPAVRPKRNTERGEGQAKLIAALTKHHQYADGGCLNLEPIGCNELARLAGVDRATASAFFKKYFKGHSKYRTLCRDAGKLTDALKMLNGEFAPHLLYGSKPADEDERDEE